MEVEDILEQLQQQFAAQQRSNAKVDVGQDSPKEEADAMMKDGDVEEAEVLSTKGKDELPETLEGSEQETTPVAKESPDEESTEATAEASTAGDVGNTSSGGLKISQERESISETNNAVLANEKVEASQEENAVPQVLEDAPEPTSDAPDTVKPVVTPPVLQFTCGRCSEIISLESEFFRCVGSACQSAS